MADAALEAPHGLKASPWGLVVALGVTQIIGWGSLYYAIALLIQPLSIAVASDQATVVGAFSVAMLVAGLSSSVIGSLIDRYGGRWVMSLGSLLSSALLAALTQVHSVPALYLIWMGLGLAMAATLYDPAFAVLGQVFQDKQRQAITVLTLFGGFASTIFWPLTQALVTAQGWQQTLWALAAINLLVCVPLHWLLVPRPTPVLGVAFKPNGQPARSTTSLRQVLRDPSFYGLCAAFAGNALVFSAMSVHLITLLNRQGLSLVQAAWIGACIGPMQVLGRVLESVFLHHLQPSRVGMLAMWLLPMSLVLLAALPTQLLGYAGFALLYGMSNGVMTIVRGALPAELYGREHYGAVNGAMSMPVLMAKAAGPMVASMLLATTRSPQTLLAALAALGMVCAALFSLMAMRRGAAVWSSHAPSTPQEV